MLPASSFSAAPAAALAPESSASLRCCQTCFTLQPADQFRLRRRTLPVRLGQCRSCHNAAERARRAAQRARGARRRLGRQMYRVAEAASLARVETLCALMVRQAGGLSAFVAGWAAYHRATLARGGQAGARSLEAVVNWSFNPSIPKKQVFDLATCRFVRETRDVLFLGPPGTGKSFLVQALGYLAIKQGFVVLYRSIFDVVRDFLHDEAVEGQEKVLARYLKPDLLIVDDMGMKQLPKRSGEYLFEIIMRRYETRSTVMTSNRPLEDWGKLIGDVPSATAILDRFLHHAEIITITGKSYRLKGQRSDAPSESGQPEPTKNDDPPASDRSKPAKAPTGSNPKKKPPQAPPGESAPAA